MKKILLTATLIAAAAGLWAGGTDGAALLEAVDAQLNFQSGDFTAVVSLVKEDPQEGVEKSVVHMFRRDAEGKFVLLFREPSVKKGQGYLRLDDNLWLYDPESRKFSHSSMKERFGDTDARNSDFGLSTLSADYAVESVADGTLGKYPVHVLDLRARSGEVTYARKRLWVTKDTLLVLKSEDYSEAGRLMRTSLHPGYTRVGQQYAPTKIVYVDELVKGKKTTITLTDVSRDAVPDSVYTKAYLERVNR